MIKLLLTSAGVNNTSIHQALVGLLGKPIDQCHALCIPTAGWGAPFADPTRVRSFLCGTQPGLPMAGLGWRSVGVLELTALPSIPRERWEPWVRGADAFLAGGGDAVYLAHWLRQSGLAELLRQLDDAVWVGFSAGSMALTPRVGEAFVESKPSITGDDRGIGLVDFSIFPHLDHPGFDENTTACAERWAAGIGNHAYAIDDASAIRVLRGKVEVVSEGSWTYFNG